MKDNPWTMTFDEHFDKEAEIGQSSKTSNLTTERMAK
jgi:hypothetical protein